MYPKYDRKCDTEYRKSIDAPNYDMERINLIGNKKTSC